MSAAEMLLGQSMLGHQANSLELWTSSLCADILGSVPQLLNWKKSQTRCQHDSAFFSQVLTVCVNIYYLIIEDSVNMSGVSDGVNMV